MSRYGSLIVNMSISYVSGGEVALIETTANILDGQVAFVIDGQTVVVTSAVANSEKRKT